MGFRGQSAHYVYWGVWGTRLMAVLMRFSVLRTPLYSDTGWEGVCRYSVRPFNEKTFVKCIVACAGLFLLFACIRDRAPRDLLWVVTPSLLVYRFHSLQVAGLRC